MSAYIPQVGDRVRYHTWEKTMWLDVLHVDGTDIFGRRDHGKPQAFTTETEGAWIKVEKPFPFPDRFINVYAAGFTGWSKTREDADAEARLDPDERLGRLAVIHIWSDGDGDHAEIERIQS